MQPAQADRERREPRVAVLAIGNELLSGKVRDENLHYLATELRALGVRLVLGLLVPDEVEAIVAALDYARARADLVLTTGGVGPTHDDVTLAALAAAFGVERRAHPGLVDAIHGHYQSQVNEDLLSMALIPEGAELIQPAPFFLPIFRLERVFAFPGEPLAFRLLFDAWKESLRRAPYHLARLELDVDEGQIAALLRRTEREHPGLAIGSYPRFDADAPYRVLVTLEGKVAHQVVAATAAVRDTIQAWLGASAVLRTVAPGEDAGAAR